MIAPTCATASVKMVNGRDRALALTVRQIALVERDVLDADDVLVDVEFDNAIDEQERISMRENPLDGGVIERQRSTVSIMVSAQLEPMLHEKYNLNNAMPNHLNHSAHILGRRPRHPSATR